MIAAGFIVIFWLGSLIIWCIYKYNAFREKQAKIDFWWDEVDVHLQIRRELIPSLLDRARPLMGSHTPTLDRIAGLREKIVLETIRERINDLDIEDLENKLSHEMQSLQAAFKQHREVQMNESLLTVMGELVSVEGKASTACEEYNKLASDYNSSIKGFPANVVAGFLHFNPREKRIFGTAL
jgi:LemA protein